MTIAKLAVAGLLAGALAGPAFAQAAEFYVVQDTRTKKCTIVDKKPETETTVVVSNGVYKTRTEAQAGLKTIKVCAAD